MMMTTIATNDASTAGSKSQGPSAAEVEIQSGSFRSSALDMTETNVVEVDVLEQLKTNLAQLEDLHSRLRFMMTEITYLLRKS